MQAIRRLLNLAMSRGWTKWYTWAMEMIRQLALIAALRSLKGQGVASVALTPAHCCSSFDGAQTSREGRVREGSATQDTP